MTRSTADCGFPCCRTLDTYQCHFDVYLRYLILELYKEYGTMILVILEAPTVARPCRWSLKRLLYAYITEDRGRTFLPTSSPSSGKIPREPWSKRLIKELLFRLQCSPFSVMTNFLLWVSMYCLNRDYIFSKAFGYA